MRITNSMLTNTVLTNLRNDLAKLDQYEAQLTSGKRLSRASDDPSSVGKSLSLRGTVATGRVERGIIKVGENVEIVGFKDTMTTTVTGVEMFRKLLDQGQAGDNVGLLLRGVDRTNVERGQVLAKPKSITPHTKFKAEIYVLTKEEGGRHTPFFNGYRPQFYFRTTDVTGIVSLNPGVEMVMPGDNVSVTGELISPIAMEQGLRFAVREGGKTVGSGVVTEILA